MLSKARQKDREWIARIPKVELHLHLEGAIPLLTLWTLIQKYGGDRDVPDLTALGERFRFRDFRHFLDLWVWKNGFIREYEDFTLMAEAVAVRLRSERVRYAEIFFSPGDYARIGLAPRGIAEAVRMGLSRVTEIEVGLVPDLVRDFGPDRARATLAELARVRGVGILGFGLGGTEPDWPPELFDDAFRQARELGFPTTVHAGEAAGPESVWGAIRALQPDRIGHGTRAIEDPELVEHLAARAIPIELCPGSNVRLGIVPSMNDHPAKVYFERGIPISINTDDPTMFNTTLAEEYAALMEVQRFSRGQIQEITRQSIQACFLPPERKRQLLEDVLSDPVWDSSS